MEDHRHRPHDQPLPEPFIAGPADAAEALAAAGGVFSWRQPEPGREMASGFELARIDFHRHRQCRDRPHTRDRRQALTDRIGLVLRGQALIDLCQLRIQLRDDPA